jgi:hypothetical protein
MSLTHVDPHVSEIVMVWIQSGDLLMVWIQISLIFNPNSNQTRKTRPKAKKPDLTRPTERHRLIQSDLTLDTVRTRTILNNP